jgi:ribose transport system ATP-binding protein
MTVTTMGAAVAGTPLPVVALSNARKIFGSVRALDGVSLEIHPGECVGLVGHNGAGKSTLVNLVNAGFAPTEGAVTYTLPEGGTGTGPTAMRAAGVRSVFQELSLCPNLSVAENLRVPQRGLRGWGWRDRAAARLGKSLDTVFPGHRIATGATVDTLGLAERQMVEIAIAFAEGDAPARLVILDEPTSSLDAAISARLLDHIRRFCAAGGAVLFISHMLGEILSVATRVVVMRDGRITGDQPTAGLTREALVDAMGHVARPASEARARVLSTAPEVISTPAGLKARRGEIVGLAGLAGHGQTQALIRYVFGQSSEWWPKADPEVAFVAGDRQGDGVMPLWSIRLNASLARLLAVSRRGMVNRAAEVALAEDWKTRIDIRATDLGAPLLSLSGGNQQKVLFARALATSAPVVVMDDPMRGVDVGTKREVYRMIEAEAARGRTFLWYSTETEETLLCDRVFVFRDGHISAELTGSAITEAAILAASFEMSEPAA